MIKLGQLDSKTHKSQSIRRTKRHKDVVITSACRPACSLTPDASYITCIKSSHTHKAHLHNSFLPGLVENLFLHSFPLSFLIA